MPAASKLTFVPFTPRDIGLPRTVHRSERDILRGDLRGAIRTMLVLATGILSIQMCYTAEEYARFIVWCLGWLLDGWPYNIPFANLSDIKGGVRPLRILRDLHRAGTLKFVRAPPDVRQRALHDPDSVLPHVIAAAALPPPPRPLTLRPPKFDLSRFQDLLPRTQPAAPSFSSSSTSSSSSTHANPVPERAHPRPSAHELVLHPDNLEPVLARPLGPDAPGHHDRRQRCDFNKARLRPVSGRKPYAPKVGVLTSSYVLDTPARTSVQSAGGKVLKPLSELRLPLMVDDHLGEYFAVRGEAEEAEEIESYSDVDVEAWAQRG
ncbi:hypothetical protein V8D89_013115 [Ganoderma adspersum]